MMTIHEAAALLGAHSATVIHSDGHFDSRFSSVSTDSRSLEAGALFVALQGERFDGHQYLETARARGAVAALVARPVDCALPQIIVDDPLFALGTLAAAWRSRFTLPVVALTGSNGKTTVKEMLRAILLAHCGSTLDDSPVLATQGNLNNHIGLPLMLLRLRESHRYAVFEMGMNHLGEIDTLTHLARPDVALITVAGTAHIGELGSRDAIAQAKGEIFAGLGDSGIAVLNQDDRYLAYWRDLVGNRRTITFGHSADSDVQGLPPTDEGAPFNIRYGDETIPVYLHVIGAHNRQNALAAGAAALALGIPLSSIQQGLEDFEGVPGRLRRLTGHKAATIIDDTYNANPDSVRAAIDVLAAFPGKRYLVLGDMGELGVDAPKLHADIGAYVRGADLDGLYAIGKLTEETVLELGRPGWHFDTIDELIEELNKVLGPNATLLVKGSRFMKMERVVEKLVPNYQGGHSHAA
ncbi:MAG: UDP-N-acetylmuramoyl-tripeptide--D-alanyl-D-alanine ligase [Betaproteobacteria bacterium]|nr:UDP-N-acetylmuramoyl-tripeptide--D-alanyl-D-alanine ligase [Betaproteobacteria bacterium]